MQVDIPITLLEPEALLPTRAYENDAGWDLRVLEPVWINVNEAVDVRTGVAVAIPDGYFGRIIGRSSALRKRGLMVVEGIIDSGFRGELFSYVFCPPTVHNVTTNGVRLERGDSVAQLIIHPLPQVNWVEVDQLEESDRGLAGFGSSGR